MSQPPAPGSWPVPPPPPPPPAPAPRPKEAKWIPPIVVLAVLAFVVFGGFLFAGEPGTAGEELTDGGEPGEPVQVAPEVTLFPPSGWSVQKRYQDPPGVRLIAGAGNLLVLVQGGGGDPQALLDDYVSQILEPDSSQLSVSEARPVPLPSGLPALRLAYLGLFEGIEAPLEGEVTVVVASGNAVAFDGWAPEGQYPAVRRDVRTMVETAEVS
jgi:hypothetical protein